MTNPKNRPDFCPKCGGTDFSDSNYCRACHRGRLKAYRQSSRGLELKERDKPKRKAKNQAYWQATKAAVQKEAEADRAAGRPTDAAKKSAKYKANHPDRLAEAQAKFYASEKGAIYKWSNTASFAIANRSLNGPSGAELRDLWYQQGGICPLTKRKLQVTGIGHSLDAPSIDRIVHDGGYVVSNIRIITRQANSARHTGTDVDLRTFCKAVLAHRGKLRG